MKVRVRGKVFKVRYKKMNSHYGHVDTDKGIIYIDSRLPKSHRKYWLRHEMRHIYFEDSGLSLLLQKVCKRKVRMKASDLEEAINRACDEAQ